MEEKTETVCRFCLETEGKGTFLTPCLCIGSGKYVHSACLTRWRATTINPTFAKKCQLCLAPYNTELPTFFFEYVPPGEHIRMMAMYCTINMSVLYALFTLGYQHNIQTRLVIGWMSCICAWKYVSLIQHIHNRRIYAMYWLQESHLLVVMAICFSKLYSFPADLIYCVCLVRVYWIHRTIVLRINADMYDLYHVEVENVLQE